MIHFENALTILCMALATYLTRAIGYVALRNRRLSPRAMTVLEAVPGCVLISVIAPSFASKQPADLIALAITLVAAMRLSMFPTVVVGVASAGLLRHFLG